MESPTEAAAEQGSRAVRASEQDAALAISWIEASVHVKDVKRSFLAARSFARLFSRGGKLNYVELLEDLQVVHK
jgi:hypothetical protein